MSSTTLVRGIALSVCRSLSQASLGLPPNRIGARACRGSLVTDARLETQFGLSGQGVSMWMTLLFSNADWAPLGSTGAATAIEMIVAAAWITITIGVRARMGESSHEQNITDRDKPRSNEWL